MKLYYGTLKKAAKEIMKNGFIPDKSYNWKIKSKAGYVYLSLAYAPFYAMASKDEETTERSLILVEVDEQHLYPDDYFIMYMFDKPSYTQKELDKINLEDFKQYYEESLQYLGSAYTKPENIKIIGCRIFDAKLLLQVCDPSITPINYKFMGNYYKELTKWIYEGNNPIEFLQSELNPMKLNKDELNHLNKFNKEHIQQRTYE